jgi:hypothetical protein
MYLSDLQFVCAGFRLGGLSLDKELKRLPFSQRNGMAPIPPQLKVGEVSSDLRRLLDYAISNEIDRVKKDGFDKTHFSGAWKEVATDLHVKLLRQSASSFENSAYTVRKNLERIVASAAIGSLFDLIEFLASHAGCSSLLKAELGKAFVDARSAYRIFDEQIIAIGTEEQGAAVERGIQDADASGDLAARRHLISSGAELRSGNWSNSVRESIHAVEAISRKIDASANTLAPALKVLERKGYIHGSLKAGFEKLYGYTNDERGIRHALSDAEARVDEADAMFMLGACASFVSYLISKSSI